MLDFPSMSWEKLPVVDRIYPQNNEFATGVENKATGNSKLNDSSDSGY